MITSCKLLGTRAIIFVVCCLSAMSLILLSPPVQALEEAEELDEAGELREAYYRYRDLFEENPEDEEVALGLLRVATDLERWEMAAAALERYDWLEPDSPEVARQATRMYYHQNELDTALEYAEIYRERAPGDWRPFHFLSQIHFARHDYLRARDSVNSAELRSPDNPWVLLDRFQLELRLRDRFDEEILDRLLETAQHANIFWDIAGLDEVRDDLERTREILETGLNFLPAERPPILRPVSEDQYRYRLARIQYRLGDLEAASETMQPVENGLRVEWFKTMLIEEPEERLEQLAVLFADNPDNPALQWYLSREARQRQGREGELRQQLADYFYREFRSNFFLNYLEASLSALNRSLEMDPLNASRQFELTRYFGERGWERSQLQGGERVEELGIDPPEQISDYLEGLRVSPTPEGFISPVNPTVKIAINIEDPLTAPPEIEEILASMFRQLFHHYPVFELDEVITETMAAGELRREVRETDIEGALRLNIRKWEEEIIAELSFYLPGEEEETLTFYDAGQRNLWRLLDFSLTNFRDHWPWTGRVFETSESGALINLGRIHGLGEGDLFELGEREFPVSEIYEQWLELEFPSPIFEGRIQRGSRARLIERREED